MTTMNVLFETVLQYGIRVAFLLSILVVVIAALRSASIHYAPQQGMSAEKLLRLNAPEIYEDPSLGHAVIAWTRALPFSAIARKFVGISAVAQVGSGWVVVKPATVDRDTTIGDFDKLVLVGSIRRFDWLPGRKMIQLSNSDEELVLQIGPHDFQSLVKDARDSR